MSGAGEVMSEDLQHRRGNARLRLGIEASFIGFDGTQAVILQDISQTGAKLLLRRATPVSQGLLQWMDYEVFAEIAWQRGHWCGVIFDEPVPQEYLLATRAAVPALMNESRERILQSAREFVQGEAAASGTPASLQRAVT